FVTMALTVARLGLAVLGGATSNTGCRGVLPKQRINAVRHALDLLDVAPFDSAELKNLAVRGRNQGIGIGVQRADAGLEGSVEECGQVRVYVEIRLGHLVKAVLVSDFVQQTA